MDGEEAAMPNERAKYLLMHGVHVLSLAIGNTSKPSQTLPAKQFVTRSNPYDGATIFAGIQERLVGRHGE